MPNEAKLSRTIPRAHRRETLDDEPRADRLSGQTTIESPGDRDGGLYRGGFWCGNGKGRPQAVFPLIFRRFLPVDGNPDRRPANPAAEFLREALPSARSGRGVLFQTPGNQQKRVDCDQESLVMEEPRKNGAGPWRCGENAASRQVLADHCVSIEPGQRPVNDGLETRLSTVTSSCPSSWAVPLPRNRPDRRSRNRRDPPDRRSPPRRKGRRRSFRSPPPSRRSLRRRC